MQRHKQGGDATSACRLRKDVKQTGVLKKSVVVVPSHSAPNDQDDFHPPNQKRVRTFNVRTRFKIIDWLYIRSNLRLSTYQRRWWTRRYLSARWPGLR